MKAVLISILALMISAPVMAEGYNEFIKKATIKAGTNAAFAAQVIDEREGWPRDVIVAALTKVPSAEAEEYLEAQEDDFGNDGENEEDD